MRGQQRTHTQRKLEKQREEEGAGDTRHLPIDLVAQAVLGKEHAH